MAFLHVDKLDKRKIKIMTNKSEKQQKYASVTSMLVS